MRRQVRIAVCLLAVAVGFLIPVVAFGQSDDQGMASTTGKSTSASSDRHALLWAVLAALLVSGSEGSSASQSPSTATVTPQPEPSNASTAETTGPSSADSTTTASTTEATVQPSTTTATSPTTQPATSATTTATGGSTSTTTTSTTDGSNASKAKPVKHQVAREAIAACLSLILVFLCLAAVDYSLLKEETKRPVDPLSVNQPRHPVVKFLLLSDDGRWAASKTLASTWTIALIWSITALALADLFKAPAGWQEFKQQAVSWQYLLLLGGPVTAAIGAQSLTLIRSQTGAEVKTTPPEGASFSQLYTDDDGKLDLIDVQYLAFNVLSILVFLIVFLANFSEGLPVFPGILATLTAATAAGYLARRAARRADPVITSIAPPAAAPGEEIQLWGVNLTPPREPEPVEQLSETDRAQVRYAERKIDVYFDGLPAPYAVPEGPEADDLSQAYKVKVPAGAKVKDGVSVVVNSGAPQGHESKPYTEFRIVGPTLGSVEPPLVQAGQQVKIWGTKLAGGGEPPRVFFDDQAGRGVQVHSGSDSTQDVIEATVPQLAAGTVRLKLLTAEGQVSNELDLSVATAVRITEAPQEISLGPNNPSLLINGLGFRTQSGPAALAAVFLAGQPLPVDQGSWQENQVTVKLPTDPSQIARLGFSSNDRAELVVRNDQGVSSAPWALKLEVPEPKAKPPTTPEPKAEPPAS